MELEKRPSWIENEHSQMLKIINFRLPHQFKTIGLVGAVVIFVALVFYKFYGSNDLLLKDVSKTVMLLFLLVASLSKDDIEDEYLNFVRYQSYVMAFVCAIGYSIFLPLIAFIMDILITRITGDGEINFHEVTAFEVMFILVCFQLLFFETLKRFGRA